MDKADGNVLTINSEEMNKPSSWGLVMKASLGSPMCSKEGSLAARLMQDVTMNEWGRRWRLRRREGRRGRQCSTLSPNFPRCYAGRGNCLGCSGRNHWTTGCVRAGGRRDENRKDTKNKQTNV